MRGDIFAWQGAHISFFCSCVKWVVVISFASAATFALPAPACLAARTCSSPGPWHVSQLMPGSAQVVRYESVARS